MSLRRGGFGSSASSMHMLAGNMLREAEEAKKQENSSLAFHVVAEEMSLVNKYCALATAVFQKRANVSDRIRNCALKEDNIRFKANRKVLDIMHNKCLNFRKYIKTDINTAEFFYNELEKEFKQLDF